MDDSQLVMADESIQEGDERDLLDDWILDVWRKSGMRRKGEIPMDFMQYKLEYGLGLGRKVVDVE